MSTDSSAEQVVTIHSHRYEEPGYVADHPRPCVRCGVLRNDHQVPTVAILPVGAVRLWNVEFREALWFSRGVNEDVARDKAERLGGTVVTCLSIPAQQTDWTTGDHR